MLDKKQVHSIEVPFIAHTGNDFVIVEKISLSRMRQKLFGFLSWSEIGMGYFISNTLDKDGFFSFKEVGFQRTDSIIYTSLSATVFIKNQPLIVRILLGHFADNHIN